MVFLKCNVLSERQNYRPFNNVAKTNNTKPAARNQNEFGPMMGVDGAKCPIRPNAPTITAIHQVTTLGSDNFIISSSSLFGASISFGEHCQYQ